MYSMYIARDWLYHSKGLATPSKMDNLALVWACTHLSSTGINGHACAEININQDQSLQYWCKFLEIFLTDEDRVSRRQVGQRNNEEDPQKTQSDPKKVPKDAQVDQKPLTCVILFEKLVNSLGMNWTWSIPCPFVHVYCYDQWEHKITQTTHQ